MFKFYIRHAVITLDSRRVNKLPANTELLSEDISLDDLKSLILLIHEDQNNAPKTYLLITANPAEKARDLFLDIFSIKEQHTLFIEYRYFQFLLEVEKNVVKLPLLELPIETKASEIVAKAQEKFQISNLIYAEKKERTYQIVFDGLDPIIFYKQNHLLKATEISSTPKGTKFVKIYRWLDIQNLFMSGLISSGEYKTNSRLFKEEIRNIHKDLYAKVNHAKTNKVDFKILEIIEIMKSGDIIKMVETSSCFSNITNQNTFREIENILEKIPKNKSILFNQLVKFIKKELDIAVELVTQNVCLCESIRKHGLAPTRYVNNGKLITKGFAFYKEGAKYHAYECAKCKKWIAYGRDGMHALGWEAMTTPKVNAPVPKNLKRHKTKNYIEQKSGQQKVGRIQSTLMCGRKHIVLQSDETNLENEKYVYRDNNKKDTFTNLISEIAKSPEDTYHKRYLIGENVQSNLLEYYRPKSKIGIILQSRYGQCLMQLSDDFILFPLIDNDNKSIKEKITAFFINKRIKIQLENLEFDRTFETNQDYTFTPNLNKANELELAQIEWQIWKIDNAFTKNWIQTENTNYIWVNPHLSYHSENREMLGKRDYQWIYPIAQRILPRTIEVTELSSEDLSRCFEPIRFPKIFRLDAWERYTEAESESAKVYLEKVSGLPKFESKPYQNYLKILIESLERIVIRHELISGLYRKHTYVKKSIEGELERLFQKRNYYAFKNEGKIALVNRKSAYFYWGLESSLSKNYNYFLEPAAEVLSSSVFFIKIQLENEIKQKPIDTFSQLYEKKLLDILVEGFYNKSPRSEDIDIDSRQETEPLSQTILLPNQYFENDYKPQKEYQLDQLKANDFEKCLLNLMSATKNSKNELVSSLDRDHKINIGKFHRRYDVQTKASKEYSDRFLVDLSIEHPDVKWKYYWVDTAYLSIGQMGNSNGSFLFEGYNDSMWMLWSEKCVCFLLTGGSG